MSISLAYQGSTVALGDRLLWTNESWYPVAQESERLTRGDLAVYVRALNSGRLIDLDGFDSNAWFSGAVINTLRVWAAIPAAQFTLTLRGTARTVMFDHERPPALDVRGIWGRLADGEFANPELLYLASFKFLEV